MTSLVLLVHAGVTCMMAGLIWFVQVVHYPLFDRVGGAGFAAYEQAHAARTTLVVGPLMVVELLTAVWLAIAPDLSPNVNNGAGPFLRWAGVALVGVIWLSTFAWQVPQHTILAVGFDADAHARLVTSNWLRTAAWTARAGLALWMLRTGA